MPPAARASGDCDCSATIVSVGADAPGEVAASFTAFDAV
jgi:hypothetical protein